MPVAHQRARTHEVRVRLGAETDLPKVRTIVSRAYQEYERRLGQEAYQRYLADVLDLDRHRRQGRILVAELHGVVCGAVAYYPDAGLQGVGWPAGWASGRGLAVDTPARGMGVAEALVRDVRRRAVEDGAPVFAFHTADFMHSARALYDRLGFQRVPRFDSDLRDYLGLTLDQPVRTLAYALPLAPGGEGRVTVMGLPADVVREDLAS